MSDATGAVEAVEQEAAEAPPARRRRGYFLPGAIALAALLVIAGAIGAGDLSHPQPRTLNGSDVAAQIALGVQEQQNSRILPQVTCPAHEPVKQGLQFRCGVRMGPGPGLRAVTVTEVDGRANLRWAFTSPGSAAPPG